MSVTRIKNNQITDTTITAAKLVDNTITAGKLEDNLTYGSNLTITGNLTVNGATTTVSTTNTTVEDAIMVLNSDATGAFANDVGLYMERGDNTSVFMGYDGSETEFALVETSSAGTEATMTITDYADLRLGGLTADDTVVATGNITGGNLITGGLASVTGNVTGGNLVTGGLASVTGNITGGNLLTGGLVNATGNVTGGNINTAGLVSATGNVIGGNINTAGLVSATGNVIGGNLVTAGVADVTGNITGGNLITAGLTSTGDLTVLASGTIEMNENVVGNIGAPVANGDAATKQYVDDALSSVFTITDGSTNQSIADGDTLTFAGTANEIEVAVSATDTLTIGLPDDVTIGNDLTVTGDLTVNGTTTTVNSTVSTLVDPIFQIGRGADNAALESDDNKDRGVTMYYYDGSEKFAFMGWDNSASTMSFYSDASNTGEVISGTKAALDAASLAVSATVVATGNITGGNLITAGLASVTGNITGGNLITAGVVVATGNITGGNLITSALMSSATISTSGEATLASAIVSDLTSGRVVLAGTSGALEDSTNLTFDGSTLGVTGAATVSTTLGVTGNITGGNLITGGLVDATGNIDGANLNTAGVVVATGNITGGNLITAGILSTASILESASEVVINEAGADVNFRVESDNNANMFFVDAGTDSVNIGTATTTADVSFKIGTTDAMMLPLGNTAQRPVTGVVGMLRFSTTSDTLEQYTSADGWESVGVPSFTVIASQTFDGDNSTVAFTLSEAQTTASCIVSINGVVQLPTTAYGVSGTTLTFTEAPLSGDKIEVRKLTTTTTVTSISSSSGGATIEANNETEIDVKGNLMPAADSAYSIGNATVRWTDIYVDAGTIHLGALQLKESGGALAVFAADGTTPADITSASTSSITNGTTNVTAANDGDVTFTIGGTGILSVDSTGIINEQADGVGNIGNTTTGFNTVHAKATSAQYADLAEKYEADADYEPGTVLHFGGEKEVSQCDVDHCTKVAGVVSTAPAYRMNDGLEAEHTAMVALQGRVPCKVQGPVAKGDMMVSAGNGKARAEADPKVGAVIGKALEDFNGEEGVIEVVIGKH
jgi:hypothetical protein